MKKVFVLLLFVLSSSNLAVAAAPDTLELNEGLAKSSQYESMPPAYGEPAHPIHHAAQLETAKAGTFREDKKYIHQILKSLVHVIEKGEVMISEAAVSMDRLVKIIKQHPEAYRMGGGGNAEFDFERARQLKELRQDCWDLEKRIRGTEFFRFNDDQFEFLVSYWIREGIDPHVIELLKEVRQGKNSIKSTYLKARAGCGVGLGAGLNCGILKTPLGRRNLVAGGSLGFLAGGGAWVEVGQKEFSTEKNWTALKCDDSSRVCCLVFSGVPVEGKLQIHPDRPAIGFGGGLCLEADLYQTISPLPRDYSFLMKKLGI